MKINSLDLIAFGPFTDRTLDFGQDSAGMTVVFGANEAGKSSALRAIRGALYGIPSQTTDNFLHNNQKLRIGVELLDNKGQQAKFLRRKGNKGTLLSVDGDILDESVIADICLGIPKKLFESLFGISHQDLTEGGEDILNQQGELGQALFSASSARKNLHLTLKKLDDEASKLYKPTGRLQTINAGLKKYAEQKSQLVESSLSSSDWANVQEAYDKAFDKTAELSVEIKKAVRELNEKQRFERLLPKVATRMQLLAQIEDYAGITQLDDSFAARRHAAVTSLITAQSAESNLQARHKELLEQVEDGGLDEQLLSHETVIQSLHQSLESYARAESGLPLLMQKYHSVESDLANLLQTIQPGLNATDLEQLLPVLAREADIKLAVASYQSLQVERKQFTQVSLTCEQKIEALKQHDTEAVDEAMLSQVQKEYGEAQAYAGLEADLRDTQGSIASMEERIGASIEALPYWNGALDELLSLAVPGKQTVLDFAKTLTDSDHELARYNTEQTRLNQELQIVQQKLDGLKGGDEVPSRQALDEVRNSRNNAWSLLKEQWLNKADVTLEAGFLDPQRGLPEAFEWRMGRADDIADRLCHDSDRVAQLESYRTEIKRFESQKLAVNTELGNADSRRETLCKLWFDEWEPCAITPRSPAEMLEWRVAREDILRLADDFFSARNKVESLKASKADLLKRLLLEPFDDSAHDRDSINSTLAAMGGWIESTLKISQRYAQQQLTRERLQEEYAAANSSVALANNALEEWQLSWRNLVEGSALAAGSVPATAIDSLQRIRAAFQKRDELRELEARINAQKKEAVSFTELHSQLAMDAGVLSLQQHVPEVYRQLDAQKQAQAVYRQNCDSLTKLIAELGRAREKLGTSELIIASLLTEAACESVEQLPDLERRSSERVNLKRQLLSLENDILQDGGGKTLDDIKVALDGLDAASLAADIDHLRKKIDGELEPLKQELSEERGSRRRELESMKGSGEVALIAEDAEDTLVKIRKATQQYLTLKTAAKLLRDEIERFRQQNQGPLLDIAGRYFSELTLGAYVGLTSDFNEQDKVILAATRSNGDIVLVEGMSNGTRDQLYLSLRLAAFERSVEQRGPMPFIVDDILIEFDDERSRAALEIFSRLAKKTQVILFSHHPRIRELSEALTNVPTIVTL